ncbi:hypothetical protein EC845_0436 [Comamonas sp. BIGb0124]|uniref:LysR family transcriptional regulator n=1 Tax=Comamonas sp. BIGb0124 TaxID=2485130 RepID=UPI000FB05843|nr:LysR family transcriptional regulator [Comamonas sp. BIGb0124]ROR24411.1 hypothetical protein EC845_0436 [Comamonas sp. BIGb0124]
MSKLHDLQRIRFDLTSIRLLIATAEQGSVTAAAERMNLASELHHWRELSRRVGFKPGD